MEIGYNPGMIKNEHIRIGINPEKVQTFKYLGPLLTKSNYIPEGIKY